MNTDDEASSRSKRRDWQEEPCSGDEQRSRPRRRRRYEHQTTTTTTTTLNNKSDAHEWFTFEHAHAAHGLELVYRAHVPSVRDRRAVLANRVGGTHSSDEDDAVADVEQRVIGGAVPHQPPPPPPQQQCVVCNDLQIFLSASRLAANGPMAQQALGMREAVFALERELRGTQHDDTIFALMIELRSNLVERPLAELYERVEHDNSKAAPVASAWTVAALRRHYAMDGTGHVFDPVRALRHELNTMQRLSRIVEDTCTMVDQVSGQFVALADTEALRAGGTIGASVKGVQLRTELSKRVEQLVRSVDVALRTHRRDTVESAAGIAHRQQLMDMIMSCAGARQSVAPPPPAAATTDGLARNDTHVMNMHELGGF